MSVQIHKYILELTFPILKKKKKNDTPIYSLKINRLTVVYYIFGAEYSII